MILAFLGKARKSREQEAGREGPQIDAKEKQVSLRKLMFRSNAVENYAKSAKRDKLADMALLHGKPQLAKNKTLFNKMGLGGP